MRLARAAVLASLITVALAAAGVAGASAAVPEVGRCVPAPEKTGEYAGKGCIGLAKNKKGAYNFVAGPGPKPKFEGTSAETPVLEMPKLKIVCSVGTFNGEYTGAKTASVTVDLIGCTNPASKKKCQSNPAKEGEIETPAPLEGELGFIKSTIPRKVGLDLKRSPSLVTFTCGEPLEVPELTGTVEGSVIGLFAPVNSMREELKLKYKTAGGKQVPEQFEGGAKDTLTVKLVSGLTVATEEAALNAKLVEVVNEEEMEIKAK
jgi:hypothetical protein